MNIRETLRDVENLRFRVQMNNRLRLECLAAISKVFREFEEPINDELLSSVIFALPQELINGNGHSKAQSKVAAGMSAQETGIPPEEPEEPGLPPAPKPSLPPQEPGEAPALPPTSPVGLPPTSPVGLPPTSPEPEAPALPPTA